MATDHEADIARVRQQLIDKGVDPKEANELARLRVELGGVQIDQQTVAISSEAPASNHSPLPFQPGSPSTAPPIRPAAASVRRVELLGDTITHVGPPPGEASPFAPPRPAPNPAAARPAAPLAPSPLPAAPLPPAPLPAAPLPAAPLPAAPLPTAPSSTAPSSAPVVAAEPHAALLAARSVATPAPFLPPPAKPELLSHAAPAEPASTVATESTLAPVPAPSEPAAEPPVDTPSPASDMLDAFAAAKGMLAAMQGGGELTDPMAVSRALAKLSRTEDGQIGRFAKKLPSPVHETTLLAMRDVLRFCATVLAGEADEAAVKLVDQLADQVRP